MRSVAIFRWDAAIPGENDESDGEKLTLLSSRPAVDAILKGLGSKEDPFDGEGGWHFDISLANETYSVFVQWTGLGKNDEHFIAVHADIRRGCLTSLFMRRVVENELLPVCEVLDAVLKQIPELSQLRWITDDEFNRVYCANLPIPMGSNVPG